MSSYKLKNTLLRGVVGFFRYLILIGLSFLILYPLFTTFVASFMKSADVYDLTVRFIPKSPTFENFEVVSIFLDYWKSLGQSVALNFGLCVIEIFSCLFVAYGFARFRFPFSKLLFGCVLLTLLIPYSTYFAPLYFQFQNYGPFHWNLISTPIPLILLSLTGVGLKDGLIIYIMTQSFKGYPRELEEAAAVDGAGPFRVFTNIMLPGAVSVSFTCFMFIFVWKWTDPTFPEIFIPDTEFLWTKLATINSRFEVSGYRDDYFYRAILKNAGVILYAIPLVILFIICKRFLVESIETTGLVG